MELSELNRAFYDRNPGGYFRQRLFNLLLVATKYDEFQELFREEVSYGTVTVHLDDEQDAGSDPDAARQSFVVAEAEVLWHHIAEVLLRLYVAHEGRPECPWLEMTALTQPREFRQLVTDVLNRMSAAGDDRLVELARVIYAKDLTPPVGELSKEEWRDVLDSGCRLIRIAADQFLQSSHLYNAAKHGFGVSAGTRTFNLYEADDPSRGIGQEGPGIEYLRRLRREGELERWQYVTDWIDAQQVCALSLMAIDLIESLLGTGRAIYVGEGSVSHVLLRKIHLEDVLENVSRGPVRRLALNFTVAVG